MNSPVESEFKVKPRLLSAQQSSVLQGEDVHFPTGLFSVRLLCKPEVMGRQRSDERSVTALAAFK